MAEQAMADIKFPTDTKWANHTYEIYQIYYGDVDTTQDQGLLNLKYGANHATGTAGSAVAQTEIEALTEITANARNTKDLEDLLAMGGYVSLTNPYKTLTKDTDGKKVSVETGYYLIKDKDGTVTGQNATDDAKAYTLYILEVVDNEYIISPKAETPTSDKQVADINDSVSTTAGEYGTDADYDIGDAVPFKLTATTVNRVHDFKNYHITFQDDYSTGLNAPEYFTVTVGSLATFYMKADGTEFYTDATHATKITENPGVVTTANGTKITVSAPTAAAGNDFAIKVAFQNKDYNASGTDAQKAAGIHTEADSQTITVTYTQVLNDNASMGSAGNPNTSFIQYSSNPNSEDDSDEGTTPPVTTIVFTYKLEMDKVDPDLVGLKNAGFVLLKERAGSYTGLTTLTAESTQADWTAIEKGTIISYNSKNYEMVKNWGVNSSGFNFEAKGIDDGNYVIVETTVPTGYNRADDVAFTVQATHDNKTLSVLSAGDDFQSSTSGGDLTFTKGSLNHTVAAGTDATVATVIENNSGATLPETGGIGTTIFYVAGSILVLAAAILLITKRRMGVND